MSEPRERRLLIQNLDTGVQIITGSKAHYLRDVLRVKVDQSLILFDGHGRTRRAIVLGTDKQGVTLDVSLQSEPVPPPKPALTVGLAMPKSSRSDWVIEKLTEFGVATIVWVTCERSVSVPHPAGERAERWQRLAEAAAHQCGRLTLPSIEGPESFVDFMQRDASEKYIADLGGHELPTPLPFSSSGILAIGPEGGFTPEEVQKALDNGYTQLRLSRNTLRVESAAMAGAVMLLAPFDA